MKNVILGTAGHIDHGKTTLIKALTGRDTDSLKEEKQRGISINLGFTYFDLPSTKRVGIVDVPGHEKFIKNMLAGACGIDIVLLVVAADEGVMPQTAEHLDILNYLGVKKGIIVLTKCDLVDEEFIELVKDEVREKTKGLFIENAPIVEVQKKFDLGEILAGKKTKKSFTFRNAGINPLYVRAIINQSEQMFRASASKTTLKSGKQASIAIELNGMDGNESLKPGEYNRMITLMTNDPVNPKIQIVIHWTVK